MAAISLKNIAKTYAGGVPVIRDVSMDIAEGEFMVFVGPSGCGKSTLMRMIAGLEDITGGELHIGGRRANDLAPVDRDVAMVFQSYALYPHMTVAENMGFGLKIAGRSKAEIRDAVGRAAEILQISHLLDRRPKALSGGQRQRVAIGRAIVRKPKVFLFDEPLSNLDASLRVQMRLELIRLHRELGATMLYVTHDQTEAMTMGDRIAVFNQGVVQQLGAPMDLYQRPDNVFVAQFLGAPRMNLLPATLHTDGGAPRLQVQGLGEWRLDAVPAGVTAGEVRHVGIRPEHLQSTAAGWPVTLSLVERLGDATLLYAQVPGLEAPLALRVAQWEPDMVAGQTLSVLPRAGHLLLFNAQGRRIGQV
ncbi:ABC transporter ATP-binding protein [Ideonella livida]|uniref:sn-glycerol-3-phosphate ABC transporter ATP-binding protein UgpC n=1 Tax=Ideonella livida TaxID=2707176 RepID=A0A7C9PHG4_9BURK|nr:sn-glycerol-3-phosphate ABC transporter ATP-binding protein UgpC [Ideonella livida]NDY91848.1 sn-glycerol-3-phosphate ABC transporter ATP-binding protein UgpC [Ideonella livida]